MLLGDDAAKQSEKKQQPKEVISRAGLASAIESGTCFVTQPGMGGSFDTQPSKLEIMTQLLSQAEQEGACYVLQRNKSDSAN